MSRSDWPLRLSVVAIAFAAILLRALVPAGYMLANAETRDGRYLIVQLCDSHDAAATAIDLDTGKIIDPADLQQPDRNDGKGADHQACVFATAAHFAAPPMLQLLVPTLNVDAVGNNFVVSSGQLAQLAALPPATGPPGLA